MSVLASCPHNLGQSVSAKDVTKVSRPAHRSNITCASQRQTSGFTTILHPLHQGPKTRRGAAATIRSLASLRAFVRLCVGGGR